MYPCDLLGFKNNLIGHMDCIVPGGIKDHQRLKLMN